MKSIFNLTFFLIFFPFFSFSKVITIKTNCVIVHNEPARFASMLKLNNSEVITGRALATLAGELDPMVLGDGGLIAVDLGDKRLLVYETNESAEVAMKVNSLLGKKFSYIELNKSCLAPVTNKLQIITMSSKLVIL